MERYSNNDNNYDNNDNINTNVTQNATTIAHKGASGIVRLLSRRAEMALSSGGIIFAPVDDNALHRAACMHSNKTILARLDYSGKIK